MPSSGGQKCALDRKSTRLNSSHGSISYAVFCLKKKLISSSNLYLSFALLRLYRACLHVGHACKSLYSPRYNIQSFTQACIFCTSSSNGQTIFFASFVLLGSILSSGRISLKRPNISVKPLFDRLFAALNLRSARVALNLEYLFLQPGYNSILESASMVG